MTTLQKSAQTRADRLKLRYLRAKRTIVVTTVVVLLGGIAMSLLALSKISEESDPEVAFALSLHFLSTLPVALGLLAAVYAFLGHGAGWLAPYAAGVNSLWTTNPKPPVTSRLINILFSDPTKARFTPFATLQKVELERLGILLRFLSAYFGLLAAIFVALGLGYLPRSQ
ncbi:hypothetical protein ASE64_07725 [Agreia sp. Leaf210]|nr:hypothetical protein ASE64_07725 [Agreia sp. Leaf210]